MKIYLIQLQDKNSNRNIGTPYLTASQMLAEAVLKTCKEKGYKAYIHKYEVKTQGKNFNELATAQYYSETEEPF